MADNIIVSDVRRISAENAALRAAGEALLTESIQVGREFCKFMMSTALAAVAVYLSLLKLTLPDQYRPSFWIGVVFIIPPILFLASALGAMWGYLPRESHFALDRPDEIEAVRNEHMKHRRKWSAASVTLFAVAMIVGSAVAVWALSLSALQT